MEETTSDIIIVGAGASGCVIAARLAMADPTLRILVLESGADTLDDSVVKTPSRFLESLDPASSRARFITSVPSEHLQGRRMAEAVANCVGGGTSINLLTYTRPVVSDLDCWESKYGNAGWGYNAMLPMFKKFETFEPLSDASTHGYDGPIHFTMGNTAPVTEQWLQTIQAYDNNMILKEDVNDFSPTSTAGLIPWSVVDGVRQDAARCFLYPIVQKPQSNVTLRTGCIVDRVILEGDVAVGVEYRVQGASTPNNVKANKYVVLSAGALGSSVLLERSGIGSPAVLSAAGVEVRVPLDGVGENYNDHILLVSVYISDPAVGGGGDAAQTQVGVTQRLAQAVAKVRPQSKEEAKVIGLNQAFLDNWSYFQEDKPVFLLLFAAGALFARLPPDSFFTQTSVCAYPFCRGRIHIRSANVEEPAEFDSGYLTHPADLSVLMWQYKWARERARRMPSYRGEFGPTHPNFAPDSQAACSESRSGPVAMDAPDIVYTAADDEVLENFIRGAANTTWHPLGTCAMKPRHLHGVVDSRLNVYGVKGLKVADMSIAPENVSCNTMSVALAIGEKAASIIAEDLGIAL